MNHRHKIGQILFVHMVDLGMETSEYFSKYILQDDW